MGNLKFNPGAVPIAFRKMPPVKGGEMRGHDGAVAANFLSPTVVEPLIPVCATIKQFAPILQL